MSVTIPKFVPMSGLSLSVMPNLRLLSATPVLQPRVVNTDLLAVPGQVEVKQVPALEDGAGAAREQVILELGAQAPARHEADGRWRDLELPGELWGAVVCAWECEQAGQGLLG